MSLDFEPQDKEVEEFLPTLEDIDLQFNLLFYNDFEELIDIF
jgi:hypothetical protein